MFVVMMQGFFCCIYKFDDIVVLVDIVSNLYLVVYIVYIFLGNNVQLQFIIIQKKVLECLMSVVLDVEVIVVYFVYIIFLEQ